MAIPPPDFFLVPALLVLAALGTIAWKRSARKVLGRVLYLVGGSFLIMDGFWVLLVAWAYCHPYKTQESNWAVLGRMFGVGTDGYLLTSLAAIACIAGGIGVGFRAFCGTCPCGTARRAWRTGETRQGGPTVRLDC